MPTYTDEIKHLKAMIAAIKAEVPKMKNERKGVSTRLQAVMGRLNAALGAAEKYEAKLVDDANNFAGDLQFLEAADEDIDALKVLIQATVKAKDEAALQKDVKNGAYEYCGNDSSVKWRADLEPQRDALLKALKKQLAGAENIGKKVTEAYPSAEAKLEKHLDKQAAAVKAIDDLLTKLDAIEI